MISVWLWDVVSYSRGQYCRVQVESHWICMLYSATTQTLSQYHKKINIAFQSLMLPWCHHCIYAHIRTVMHVLYFTLYCETQACHKWRIQHTICNACIHMYVHSFYTCRFIYWFREQIGLYLWTEFTIISTHRMNAIAMLDLYWQCCAVKHVHW